MTPAKKKQSKKKDIEIVYDDGSKEVIPSEKWEGEINRQKELKKKFDSALVGVNKDSLDDVMDALMKKFLE